MKLKYFTENPLQDITDGAFDFFGSPLMRKESQDLFAAAVNNDLPAFKNALVEYYTSASAYSVAITIERLLTAEQKQVVDEAVAKHKAEMVDDVIAQIFKENNE